LFQIGIQQKVATGQNPFYSRNNFFPLKRLLSRFSKALSTYAEGTATTSTSEFFITFSMLLLNESSEVLK
jgi:hypothetical protein